MVVKQLYGFKLLLSADSCPRCSSLTVIHDAHTKDIDFSENSTQYETLK